MQMLSAFQEKKFERRGKKKKKKKSWPKTIFIPGADWSRCLIFCVGAWRPAFSRSAKIIFAIWKQDDIGYCNTLYRERISIAAFNTIQQRVPLNRLVLFLLLSYSTKLNTISICMCENGTFLSKELGEHQLLVANCFQFSSLLWIQCCN